MGNSDVENTAFWGPRAVICISKFAGVSAHRAGFSVFVAFGLYMGQISACAWLRGIAGQKRRLSTLYLEEALFALLLLDSAQPAHPAWRAFYFAAVGGGWYITGNYHQTRNRERRESNYFGKVKKNLIISSAPPDALCDCSPLCSSMRAVCESVMTTHAGQLHGRWKGPQTRQAGPTTPTHPPNQGPSRGPRSNPRSDQCQSLAAQPTGESKSAKTLPNFCVFLG